MTKNESPLRRLRRARTINQEQLAAIVGVTQETISKAERGILPLSRPTQELIATILGATVAELFPSESSEQVSA